MVPVSHEVVTGEPTSNLDTIILAMVEHILFTLNRDHGITSVIDTTGAAA